MYLLYLEILQLSFDVYLHQDQVKVQHNAMSWVFYRRMERVLVASRKVLHPLLQTTHNSILEEIWSWTPLDLNLLNQLRK